MSNQRRQPNVKVFLCYFTTVFLLVGCNQGNTTGGVSEAPPYSQAEVENIVARAPIGTVGIYSASKTQGGTAYWLMGCKIDWVYMYRTKTYLDLRGCSWNWAYITGSWRTQGAAVGTTAKANNMTIWFNRTYGNRWNYAVL